MKSGSMTPFKRNNISNAKADTNRKKTIKYGADETKNLSSEGAGVCLPDPVVLISYPVPIVKAIISHKDLNSAINQILNTPYDISKARNRIESNLKRSDKLFADLKKSLEIDILNKLKNQMEPKQNEG